MWNVTQKSGRQRIVLFREAQRKNTFSGLSMIILDNFKNDLLKVKVSNDIFFLFCLFLL